MYIPRHFLEKAAARMAGALETNDDVMYSGEPGMFGPESSVIPQQTLETVVPIQEHVYRTEDEVDDFLYRMFEKYEDSLDEEEPVGYFDIGETEIPMEEQAVDIGVAGRLAE